MRRRRPLTVAVVTATALLIVGVVPASAHPFVAGGATAPAGSLTTLTLAMGHGCGTEDDAGGDPTTEVALEIPAAFSYLAADDQDGYTVSTEGGQDGAVPDVVIWTAVDGGVPAPEVTFDVVVDGQLGDEVHLRVFQGCDGFEYRWIGTPDEPAEDPAVLLTLTDADPDAPAPPAPPVDQPPADTEADAGEATDAAVEPDADAAEEPAATPGVDELPTEPPADEGGIPGWVWIVGGALALAAVGGLIGSRRRPVLEPTARDEPPLTP
ncbi:MAG: DUF1775 domain-containing protein [Nitriliruptor sp.]|uniref:DUF1775 domain-containing protein n=1 Tax=Nitriliruptor sp. TaxID=2448056 RepID=UPI0034A08E97